MSRPGGVAFDLPAFITKELERRNLRRAAHGEAGWFVTLEGPRAIGCNSATLRIWATDSPCPPVRNDAP